MSNHPERIIQYNIVDWLRCKHPTIQFQANMAEQKATIAWRQICHRMGFRKGVSDLFFPAGSTLAENPQQEVYKGLWLELKTEDGKATKEQKQFVDDMIKLGYAGFITFGHDDAKETIQWFYNLPY